MKILILNGSPRKWGNTPNLVEEFVNQATQDFKNECKVLNVNTLNIKDCKHCNYCQKEDVVDKCIIKDDITNILEGMFDYDVLIVASPLYFYHFTSPVKAFLDRMYSINKTDLKLGAIISSGSDFFDGGSALAIETLRKSCDYCGMDWVGAVQKTTYDQIVLVNKQDQSNINKLLTTINNKGETLEPHSVYIQN